MTRRWWLWIRYRWRGLTIWTVALLAVLTIWLVATAGPAADLTLLGNIAAPRTAARTAPARIPRSSDPNAAIGTRPDSNQSLFDDPPATSGPQTTAGARAAWTADVLRQHQHDVLQAVNCARQREGRADLILTPTLSTTAGEAWLKLVHDRTWSLMALPDRYELRSVIALHFAPPTAVESDGETEHQEPGLPPCSVGGFDAAALPWSDRATRIGIAVFPPQASWDSASAVVLVQ